jgi:ubiquinone/menaquinone biosynthesis C-methylase UbiE
LEQFGYSSCLEKRVCSNDGTNFRLDEINNINVNITSFTHLSGLRYLDLAGGTGDISFRIIEALKDNSKNNIDYNIKNNKVNEFDSVSEVILTDINDSMLEVAKVTRTFVCCVLLFLLFFISF